MSVEPFNGGIATLERQRSDALLLYWGARNPAEERAVLQQIEAIEAVILHEWTAVRGMSPETPYAFWLGKEGTAQ